ncbi:hypothetical protein [Bordetella sp. H567]|uniref:hypothetical protein n=1 Tax=Bordetella sp. H567 TaxID=1697043 RepID=UPI0011AB38B9|nr:hypothetical protein [Bordetella sp. H567]
MALYEENGKFHDLTIYSETSSDDFKRWIQSATKENVHYTCDLKKLTAEGVSVYQLQSCAAGNWSNVAPYLVKASQQLQDCHYDPGRKTWNCPDKNTPINHYKTYFSAPVLQSNGSYQSQAAVPLTELGN